MEDNIVIVVDCSNYKSEYQEAVPFKAIVKEKYDNEVIVKSMSTNKEFSLYFDQILEYMDIKEIKILLDVSKYGDY